MLAACYDFHADVRTLRSVPTTIGTAIYRIVPDSPLRGIGPATELCLTLPKSYKRIEPDTNQLDYALIARPDGGHVSIKVALIAPDGTVDSLPTNGFMYDGDQHACYMKWVTRDLSRRYQRIEIRATDTLTVTRIVWRSEERYAWL